MARRDMNFNNEAPRGLLPVDASSEQVKAEFGRRLQSMLTHRGWTQSQFAKEVASATGRELQAYHVSNYIRGRSLPRQDILFDMAKTLRVEPAEMLPHRGTPEVQRVVSPLEIRETEDGNVWLKLNRAVSYPTALKIMALLTEDDNARPSGSPVAVMSKETADTLVEANKSLRLGKE